MPDPYTLKDVLAANAVLDKGLKLFQEFPMEFVKLISQNLVLAKEFAESFSPEYIEKMLATAYKKDSISKNFSVDKFFSAIIELITRPEEIVVNNPLTITEMQIRLWESNKLTLYDLNQSPHDGLSINTHPTTGEKFTFVYAYTDKEQKLIPVFWCRNKNHPFTDASNFRIYIQGLAQLYRSIIGYTDVIFAVIQICNILLKKLKSPNILNAEFTNEKWTGPPLTNRIFPRILPTALAPEHPNFSVFTLVARILQFTSPDIALRELAASPPGSNGNIYLKQIIESLPYSRKAYNQVLAAFHQTAEVGGPQALRRTLDSFNFDILHTIEKTLTSVRGKMSIERYLLEFYEIGEMCRNTSKGEENLMMDKYPKSAPKCKVLYQAKQEKEKKHQKFEFANAPPALPTYEISFIPVAPSMPLFPVYTQGYNPACNYPTSLKEAREMLCEQDATNAGQAQIIEYQKTLLRQYEETVTALRKQIENPGESSAQKNYQRID